MPPAGSEGEIAIDPELYESPFSDIDSGSALGEAAAFLYDTGVIGGYADGSFRPDRPLTRAAATKFIMRLHHDRLPQVANAGRIRDLPASAWFTPYMLAAVDEGYLRVPGNRLLRPGAPITLRAFFEMFARAANPPGSGRAKPDYSDRDLVDLATRFGLFPKSGVTTEELGRTVSRGEGVRALYNFAARPQLHYIGVRHGRYPVGHERGVGRCYRAFGRVEVTIRPGSKPIGLALAAHEPVIWEIELAPGAQIAKIWLGGYHLQRLEGVPEGVPVARHGYYRTVPPEAGEARWFVDSAEPDRGYYMGSCTAEELRADGAPPAPPESRRRYFHVASEGLFFSTYRQIEDCEDMFCRSQVQRDLETFRKLAGARISTFQGRYAGRHFILDPF